MSNGLTRGVPVQELLENQHPAVLFNVDEQTRVVTPLAPAPAAAEEPKPKRAAKKVTDAAEGEGE